MQHITEEDWEFIVKKYGKLFHYISQGIFGDTAIGKEDSYADLCVSAINAINGYARKEGKKFEEFKTEKGFDAYIKTSLWNVQNTKRAYITPRLPIRAKEMLVHSSYNSGSTDIIRFTARADGGDPNREDNQINQVPDKSASSEVAFNGMEYFSNFPPSQKKVIKFIFKHPKSLLENGNVNVKFLAKKLNMAPLTLKQILFEIGTKIKQDLIE
jgi:hypothetical protein